jgi:hypothetical protein
VNSALKFTPASNNYVAVADFNPPAALTLEAWINPGNNAGTDSIILNKHNSEYDFRINGAGNLSASAGGTNLTDTAFNFYSAASVNQWYHVVYTFDYVTQTHALYRNGVKVASGSNAATISNQATQLWIGRHSQFNFGTFMGSIDEVRIYGRALSASEVLADFNAQKPAAPSIVTQPASQTVNAGQTATFSVVAQGAAPLSYQWQKNGANISGANAASYITPTTTLADSGAVFTVLVSNSVLPSGVLSSNAVLTVNALQQPPVITSGPSATPNPALTGQVVAFSAAASDPNGDPLTFSWNFGDGSNGTGSSASHAYATAGTFTAQLTVSDGKGGSATGNTIVTVNSPALCTLTTSTNGSGAGSISLSPPGGSYAAGTVVTLTASPASGSVFTNWSGAASGTANPLAITINSNAVATATFNLSGLVAWWKFDEGSGASAADSSGNGHTGTLVNGPAWTTGVKNSGLNFNPAGNSYVAVADFNPPAALTMEAWIFPGNNTGTDSIILNKHNQEYDFRLTGLGYLSGGAGGTPLTDSSFSFYDAANVNQWHHVVYTFDNVTHTHALYRNGAQVATGTNNATITNQSTQLWIGRHSQYNFGTFRGALDEVRIYQRPISAAEVLANYNSTKSIAAASTAAASASASGALNVTRLQASIQFTASNADTCSISGTFVAPPPGFNPKGQTLVVDVGGAMYSFVLNAKAQGKSSQGSATLKLAKPPASTKKTAPTKFSAKLIKCSLASIWSLDRASKGSAKIASYVSVDLGRNTYESLVTLSYSTKVNVGAKLKK